MAMGRLLRLLHHGKSGDDEYISVYSNTVRVHLGPDDGTRGRTARSGGGSAWTRSRDGGSQRRRRPLATMAARAGSATMSLRGDGSMCSTVTAALGD